MSIIDIAKKSTMSNEDLLAAASQALVMNFYQYSGGSPRRAILLDPSSVAALKSLAFKEVENSTGQKIRSAVSNFLGLNPAGDLIIKSMKAAGAAKYDNVPASVCYSSGDALMKAVQSINEVSGYGALTKDDERPILDQAVSMIPDLVSDLSSFKLFPFVVDSKKAPNFSPGIQNGSISSAKSVGSFGSAMVMYIAPVGSANVRLHIPWDIIVRDALAVEFAISKARSQTFNLDRFSKFIAHIANESGGTSNAARFELRLIASYSKESNKVKGLAGIRKPKTGTGTGDFLSISTSLGVAQDIPYNSPDMMNYIANLLIGGGLSLDAIGIQSTAKVYQDGRAVYQIMAGLANPSLCGFFNYAIFSHDYEKRIGQGESYWASYAGYSKTPSELKGINDASSLALSIPKIVSHKYIPIWLSKASYQLLVIRSILGLP